MAVEIAASEVHAAAAIDTRIVRIDPRLQYRQGRHHLEGRAGADRGRIRHLSNNGLRSNVSQATIVRRTSVRSNEPVGVETGRRGHAQDVAGAAVHHHGAAALLAEHLQRPVLNIDVKGQLDFGAGHGGRDVAARRGGCTSRPLASTSTLRAPGLAAQLQIEGLLHALFADPEAGVAAGSPGAPRIRTGQR